METATAQSIANWPVSFLNFLRGMETLDCIDVLNLFLVLPKLP